VAASSEHRTETSVSLKRGEFRDWLREVFSFPSNERNIN
jgi:hypothetical protein